MKIIDVTDLIAGRAAAKIAKMALLGEEVAVVNCSKAIISGKRGSVLSAYAGHSQLGTHTTGPYHYRNSHQIMKRMIRGMLPYKQEKGLTAFKRVKCYSGLPEEFKDKAESFKDAHKSKLPTLHYVTLGQIVSTLGGKE